MKAQARRAKPNGKSPKRKGPHWKRKGRFVRGPLLGLRPGEGRFEVVS